MASMARVITLPSSCFVILLSNIIAVNRSVLFLTATVIATVTNSSITFGTAIGMTIVDGSCVSQMRVIFVNHSCSKTVSLVFEHIRNNSIWRICTFLLWVVQLLSLHRLFRPTRSYATRRTNLMLAREGTWICWSNIPLPFHMLGRLLLFLVLITLIIWIILSGSVLADAIR